MTNPNLFACAKCGAEIITCDCGCGTGYAILPDVGKICYDCSAEIEKKFMRDHERSVLYLTTTKENGYEITDWPGRLRIPVAFWKKGKHNIASTRYDVWFMFEGFVWHGVQYGEFTQLCHVKRTKYTSLEIR
jgi:hypothetical protein